MKRSAPCKPPTVALNDPTPISTEAAEPGHPLANVAQIRGIISGTLNDAPSDGIRVELEMAWLLLG